MSRATHTRSKNAEHVRTSHVNTHLLIMCSTCGPRAVPHANESCCTHKWVMSHIRMNRVAHTNTSCYKHQLFSLIPCSTPAWLAMRDVTASHVTQMKWVTWHVWSGSRRPYECITWQCHHIIMFMRGMLCIGDVIASYKYVTSHTTPNDSHVTRIQCVAHTNTTSWHCLAQQALLCVQEHVPSYANKMYQGTQHSAY